MEKGVEDREFSQLKFKFEQDGISVRPYTTPSAVPVSQKNYLLANHIKMISSWIVFFIMTGLLAVAHLVANKLGYLDFTYLDTALSPWAFFGFALAFLVAFPIVYSVIYFLNPTKKVVSRYNPKISLIFALLFFVQCLVIIYVLNISFGFVSFTQTDFNQLRWLLPSVCALMLPLSSIVYSALFKSKKFNV